MKSLAATVVNNAKTTIAYDAIDSYVKALNIHLETPAPSGFTPSEANTISISTSQYPVYIVFDNTNNAGIMHFYTKGEKISLPSDSSYMFYYYSNLADFSDLSDWDSSNVTNMSYMFRSIYTSTFSLDLSSWNTSKVTAMTIMFASAGNSASSWSVTIPRTNGNYTNNTVARMYGKTTSTYGAAPSGRSFTLAQP